jgi:hypothetical protein
MEKIYLKEQDTSHNWKLADPTDNISEYSMYPLILKLEQIEEITYYPGLAEEPATPRRRRLAPAIKSELNFLTVKYKRAGEVFLLQVFIPYYMPEDKKNFEEYINFIQTQIHNKYDLIKLSSIDRLLSLNRMIAAEEIYGASDDLFENVFKVLPAKEIRASVKYYQNLEGILYREEVLFNFLDFCLANADLRTSEQINSSRNEIEAMKFKLLTECNDDKTIFNIKIHYKKSTKNFLNEVFRLIKDELGKILPPIKMNNIQKILALDELIVVSKICDLNKEEEDQINLTDRIFKARSETDIPDEIMTILETFMKDKHSSIDKVNLKCESKFQEIKKSLIEIFGEQIVDEEIDLIKYLGQKILKEITEKTSNK